MLEFARLATASGDSSDEYWALDNVTISAIPEPAQLGAIFGGLAGAAGVIVRLRQRRRAAGRVG